MSDGVGWESGRRGTRELFLALLRSKTFVAGAIILVFWIVDAIFWPLIVPQDPEAIAARDHVAATVLGSSVRNR